MTTAIVVIVSAMLTAALEKYDELIENAANLLTNSASSLVNTEWGNVIGMSNTAFTAICNIIIAICVLVELAQVAAKVDIIKWEHAIKIGVKMALAKSCMEIAPDFLEACYAQVCDGITSVHADYTQPKLGAKFLSILSNTVNKVDDLGGAVSLLVTTLLLMLAIRVCSFLVVSIAYVRNIEILMYLMISPLPCSFFPFGEGINRITVRFFKGFIAVCLQGLFMYMCIRLFGAVINGITVDSPADDANAVVSTMDLCWQMIMYSVMLILAITKCGSWAKSIMDVA